MYDRAFFSNTDLSFVAFHAVARSVFRGLIIRGRSTGCFVIFVRLISVPVFTTNIIP
jgi:hypothetical protein